MVAIAFYLLKVPLCSGILFGYYWIALRNKKFHVYNRFYLLISLAISWLIPLMKFNIQPSEKVEPQIINLLTVVSTGNKYVEVVSNNSRFGWDTYSMIAGIFILISATVLTRFIFGLIRIKLLIQKSQIQKLNKIYFISSSEKGTPFSFFNYIFWNENIPLESEDGRHILKHELAHVQENHSADKLFFGLSLIIGWYNPFMWCIRKELNLVHEFIADEKAFADGDTAAFASMILNSAFSPYRFPLSNSFFYSPLKRRLLMITSSKSTRFTYIRRVAILPLLLFTCLFFSFNLKKRETSLTSKSDISFIQQNQNPESIAGKELVVLDTVIKPGKSIFNGSLSDSITRLRKDTIVPWENETLKQGNFDINLTKYLVVVDGVMMTWEDFKRLDLSQNRIKHINVLKGESAIAKFGDQAKGGVIEISTVTASEIKKIEEPSYQKIFTKVENPPAYKGNFSEYLKTNLRLPVEALNTKIKGNVIIKFVVDEDGNLTSFKPVTSIGNGLEEEAIRLIRNSSPWKPAMQNGRKVVFEVRQEIAF